MQEGRGGGVRAQIIRRESSSTFHDPTFIPGSAFDAIYSTLFSTFCKSRWTSKLSRDRKWNQFEIGWINRRFTFCFVGFSLLLAKKDTSSFVVIFCLFFILFCFFFIYSNRSFFPKRNPWPAPKGPASKAASTERSIDVGVQEDGNARLFLSTFGAGADHFPSRRTARYKTAAAAGTAAAAEAAQLSKFISTTSFRIHRFMLAPTSITISRHNRLSARRQRKKSNPKNKIK